MSGQEPSPAPGKNSWLRVLFDCLFDYIGATSLGRRLWIERQAVRRYPVILIAFSIGSFCLGFFFKTSLDSKLEAERDTAQTNLRIADGELAQWRNKAVAPGLKDANNNADEWSPLADWQMDQWAKELQPSGIRTLKVIWSPEVNAKTLFRSLQSLGRRISCDVVSDGGYWSGSSIEIWTAKGDPAAPILQRLFGQMAITRIDEARVANLHESVVFIPDKLKAMPP